MMLAALHDAMIYTLQQSNAKVETISAYEQRWQDTLDGHRRAFPCPACFQAGKTDSELKALPAKPAANTHYVACKTCNREYSYVDADS